MEQCVVLWHINRLINETRLYLFQHAHNAVDWVPL
jgi:uncharacterized protein YyaL (SSP411 family)